MILSGNITYFSSTIRRLGFPLSSISKEPPCNAGDQDLIPELGGSLGEGRLLIPVFLPGESHAGMLRSTGSQDLDTT